MQVTVDARCMPARAQVDRAKDTGAPLVAVVGVLVEVPAMLTVLPIVRTARGGLNAAPRDRPGDGPGPGVPLPDPQHPLHTGAQCGEAPRRSSPARRGERPAASPSVARPGTSHPAGRIDAFNRAKLFLTALVACMLKNLERLAPMLFFCLHGAEVRLHGVRQDKPPKLTQIDYEVVIDTDEPDRRLDLMHENMRKYGTISNTVAAAVALSGTLVRKAPPAD
jgi:uncharacterized OsmC-like protein